MITLDAARTWMVTVAGTTKPLRVCRMLAALTVGISASVILGWAIGSRLLTSILPGYITMKANTAVSLGLLAGSILLLSIPPSLRESTRPMYRRVRLWIAGAASMTAGIVGLLTLIEYYFGVNLGIDELLFADPESAGRFPPGRLAPITAILLVLLAVGQLLLIAGNGRRIKVMQGLTVISFFAAFQAIVGYASGVTYMFGSAFYTQMAIQTAIGIVFVCAAMLLLNPDLGIMVVALGRSESARMMRVVLAAAIIVPPLVSFFELKGLALGLYGPDFGVLMRVMANVLFLSLIVWEKGSTLHAVDAGRQRVEANAQLVHQIQFKDEFLSHVSHELRSPLTAIKQFTSILLGGLAGDLTTEQREYQQIVLRNVVQLQSMIDDLLEVTRLESGKLSVEPERASLCEAVMDTLDTLQGLAAGKGIRLTSELPADLPWAYADKTRLRQALIILVDNAIKFTPPGGAVTVGARPLAEAPLLLEIRVSDNGCGISPANAGRIFDRLYQAEGGADVSRKGLGLGLYICRELVTRQGGEIRVDSAPHKGSVFSFTVPIFSLTRIIEPLFKDGRWPRDSVALIRVENAAGHSASAMQLRESCERTRGILQRCLLPDEDVLLPGMATARDREQFFIASFADPNGAAVLVHRIREQLERHCPSAGLSVAYRMLPLVPPPRGGSPEQSVAVMAATFESAITADAVLETVHHE